MLLSFIYYNWRGESGRSYKFKVALTKNGVPVERAGIYIMVRRRWLIFLDALYIGKAADLRGRLVGHERWFEAWTMGATEWHVLTLPKESLRRAVEEDLIRGQRPPLNNKLIPRGRNDAPIYSWKLWPQWARI